MIQASVINNLIPLFVVIPLGAAFLMPILGKASKRIAKLIDSPNMPDAECVFDVLTEGIRDSK